MRVYHESCKGVIVVFIDFVFDHCQKVESGQNGCCKVDIVVKIECDVVRAFEWICCCNDTASRLETGVDACLGNTDCLLLHGLVNGGSILVIHFIKLINKTNSLISQDQCSSLKCPFLSDWISMHSSSQTDSTCSLSGSVDYSWEDLLNILEELRLGSSWVSQEQTVDVSSDLMFATNILGHSSKHSQCNGFLDELMPVDSR